MKANQSTLRRVERAQELARDLENELDNAAASIDTILAARDQKRKNAKALREAKSRDPRKQLGEAGVRSLEIIAKSLASEIEDAKEDLRKEMESAQKYLGKITAIMNGM